MGGKSARDAQGCQRRSFCLGGRISRVRDTALRQNAYRLR
jgi:hypothetical protein